MSNTVMHDDEPVAASHNDILRYSLGNTEMEQAILSSLLIKGEFFNYAAGWLQPHHFYQTPHQVIFTAMSEQFAAQCPIDVVSVTTYLRENNLQDQTGGLSYVMELAMSGASMTIELGGESTFRYYASKVIKLAKRRQTVKVADQIAESACNLAEEGYVDIAQSLLMGLAEDFQTEERKDAGQSLQKALDILQNELTSPNGVTGLSTGLPSLDAKTHGFQPHQLITVAARPGGGKSALAMNIASHVAIQEQKPVLYISLEMTSEELMKRLIKAMAGTESDMVRMSKAAQDLQAHQHRFLIEDSGDLTLSAIQSLILKSKKTHPDLGLIVIDHIGLIPADPKGKKHQLRTYEIQEITTRFKVLAKAVQVPILQLAQMNRAIEARQEKKPMLSDLKDSGSIENDSDIVLFTYIERDEQRRPTGNASLTIAKQRDGVQAEIPLCFVPHLTIFKEMVKIAL